MTWHRLNAVHAPLTYLAETLGVLTVFGFGAWQLTQGRVSLGELLSFAILVAYMYPQVQELAGWPLAVSAATASGMRVGEILDGRVPAMTVAGVYGGEPDSGQGVRGMESPGEERFEAVDGRP